MAPKKTIYQCRSCKQPINTEVLEFGIDYVMPKKGVYYHASCYEKKNKIALSTDNKETNDVWLDALYRYMRYDLCQEINYPKLQGQWNSYLNNKMTAKGIYYAVRYMYDIKKLNPDKAEGGIGLVPSIYEESSNYWTNMYNRQIALPYGLREQQRLIDERISVIVTRKKKEENKQKWQLAEGDNDG